MVLENKKINKDLYLLIVILCTISMVTYTFPDYFDITNYYERAEEAVATGIGMYEYLLFNILDHIDFIYNTTLFWAVQNAIPLNCITILILSLYYIFIAENIKASFKRLNINIIYLAYGMLSCPFIWVQEVPRTLAAIMFIYWGMLIAQKGKPKISVLLFFIAFFTHVVSALFLLSLLLGWLLKGFKLNKGNQLKIIVAIAIVGFAFSSSIIGTVMNYVSGFDNHYSAYGRVEMGSLFSYDSIGYGDRLSAVMIYATCVFLVLVTKSRGFMYNCLFVLTCFLTFFMLTNFSLTMRTCMFLPLFITYNICDIYIKKGKDREKLKPLVYIGMLTVIIEFYFYRMLYTF